MSQCLFPPFFIVSKWCSVALLAFKNNTGQETQSEGKLVKVIQRPSKEVNKKMHQV